MKHQQASIIVKTRQAMGTLSLYRINGSHQAAEAIRRGGLDPKVVEEIKTAYGTNPEVKKALAAARPS